MKNALLSVSDKTGLIPFARALVNAGFRLISTGGTFRALTDAGLPVTAVDEATGFPECFDGRVKTLHPKIHGGILYLRDSESHAKQAGELGVEPIDMVVVNLYPFKQTILKPDCALPEAIENIDIGGPAMLRSAAKNYRFVSVLTDPADYPLVERELAQSGRVCEKTSLLLAAKVFAHTAAYDALIASYLKPLTDLPPFPETYTVTYEKAQDMRYGENPHQAAAFYREILPAPGALTGVKQLHGKELSFNNINDTHGALELLKEYEAPAVVACKHSNPCGVGEADTIQEAYMKAYTSDPVSIFGGIVAANREIDELIAVEISKIFIEIILAPSYTPAALDVLTRKKNIRVLTLDNISVKQPAQAVDIKKVSGGILIQQTDGVILPDKEPVCVTKRKPSEAEIRDLMFAWKIVKYVKSNGIAIGKDGQSLGIGCGQVNRIWAARQAIEHCEEALGAEILQGAALASDAFFPFPDCVEEARKAGITSIIQPGGSLKDKESIEACDKYGIAMLFTEMRHFRH
ncbi:MAG: bifunctional phosphoribosylaminoimidazolecarboxamide formyltransferase/IMP cyclohydrolase [Clostridiales bacterium]|jgi:phosphoribosylaminoimidazolecarboxamide formyltransferase/IMP cyclohydrolase|nr:bifunctional phosphoribosylaminoimidazolecarboxamide formyltransferase/IMP cyclohydrolase [Clostridiales bacterium]